jgi:hypothetical protein
VLQVPRTSPHGGGAPPTTTRRRPRSAPASWRGLKHYFTGFLRVPPGGDPKKFFEFADKPPTRLERYDKEWWFVAN